MRTTQTQERQKGQGRANKTSVVGAVERDGKIRLQVVHARDRKTLRLDQEERGR